MKWRQVGMLLFVLGTVTALQAHSDPMGDVRPVVLVVDVGFVVCFRSSDERTGSDYSPTWKMSFSADGKILLPRHRIPVKLRDSWAKGAAQMDCSVHAQRLGDERKCRFVLDERVNGKMRSYPLPLEPVDPVYGTPACRAGDEVGFSWSLPRGTQQGEVKLMFSAASLKGFARGISVEIGKPATIYDMPRVSNTVWAAGRWWIAWVRTSTDVKDHDDPHKAWKTILTSINPVTGKTEDEVLPGLSNWNTDLSMKTVGGWLCVAWHASMDGQYPGVAKIVTAFKKLPE